ncbi:hypothetical protein D9758_005720 [Tetrapyrgos nigripes]|uniref:Uncharacterized protein n=1 Tax=Tetrapyrgos nigripes TaxID=182062 RepID=A0A8H5GK41_9AGAR|nr:hypothetical protein D9758_005720 [Tetrapyrgos nigripes]
MSRFRTQRPTRMGMRGYFNIPSEIASESLFNTRSPRGKIPPAEVYEYLRNPVPPSESLDPSHPSGDMENAMRYLYILVTNIHDPNRKASERRELLMEYDSNFSHIWPWTSMLVQRALEHDATTEEGVAYRDSLLHIFPKVAALPNFNGVGLNLSWTLKFMQQRPDLFPSIIHVFTYTLNRSHSSLEEMFLLLLAALQSCEADEAMALRTADVIIHSDTIDLLFSYISTVLQKRPVTESVCSAVQIITLLSVSSPKILIALIIHNTVQHCSFWCKTIFKPRRLAGLDENVRLKEKTVEFVKHIIKLFGHTIQFHGPPAMVIVLRHGFLETMVHAGTLIAYDVARPANQVSAGVAFQDLTLAKLFSDVLGHLYWMLRLGHILNLTVTSWRKVSETDNPARRDALQAFTDLMTSASQSPHPDLRGFGKLWEDVTNAAVSTKTLRQQFEDEGLIICANPDEPPNTTNYVGCDKQDWKKHNHRAKCNQIHDSATGPLKPMMTDVDRYFNEWINDRFQQPQDK